MIYRFADRVAPESWPAMIVILIAFWAAMLFHSQVGWDGLCPPNTHYRDNPGFWTPRNICHWPWENPR